MARTPVVTRDQVPEQFREAFDQLTAESGGVITGWSGWIYHRQPGDSRQRGHLTSYLRYETTFSKKSRNWPSSPQPEPWTAPMSGTPMRPPPAAPG